MAFDPDAFLAEKPAQFDPDAFLASTPAPAPAPKKSRVQQAIDSFQPENIAQQVAGLGEAATQLGTGMVGQAVGGLRGLGTLVTGGGVAAARKKIRDTEEALTYQPRGEHGRAAAGLAALPMELATEAGGAVGEAVGGNAGRAIGSAAPAIAATLAGGGAALRAAPKVPQVRPVLERARAAVEQRGQPTAAQVAESRVNAPQIDAANAAQRHGISIDPSAANPSLKNRAAASFVGESALSEAMSKANAGKAEMALKRDIGIAPDAPISMESINRARAAAAEPSAQIAQLPPMRADAAISAELNALRNNTPTIGGETAARLQNKLTSQAMDMVAADVPPAVLLENISSLRKRARDIRKMADAGPERLATADTSIGIANALEGMIERNLQTSGNVPLMQQFRDGRTAQAKSYLLEDITDMTTGKIDATKLHRLASEDNAMTGVFKDIGDIAGNFPESFGSSGSGSGAASYAQRRAARLAIPGVLGEVASAMTTLPRNMLAKTMASRGYQSKNAVPRDFRPRREQLGYADTVAEPPPLSLAPEGTSLPTTRQNIEPTVRPTLELSPMNAEVAALRNKGARTPMGSGPVEFTPGGGKDFMLRQEGLTQPAMSEAINGFRARAADLEKKVANASGMWKQKYQAELDALKQEFGAGMEQFGVRSPQEAIGFQPLYEGGRGTRLPVQQTFDPRIDALRRK